MAITEIERPFDFVESQFALVVVPSALRVDAEQESPNSVLSRWGCAGLYHDRVIGGGAVWATRHILLFNRCKHS